MYIFVLKVSLINYKCANFLLYYKYINKALFDE